MKLANQTNVIERSGDIQQTEFKIKATAKAFSILSSGLYSDKILAIVRELSCNAYDAHVAAGRADRPIEVKLPSAISPTFFVKDYGTGLSHEQVLTLYTTYFESTKSDSNDFIGALGLGSKSPFAYANSFSVKSRYNGVIRSYLAYLNEDGVPSISLLSTNDTTEENGVEVSLDIKSSDFHSFHAAAVKAFKYFPVKPIVNNVVDHEVVMRKIIYHPDYSGNGWMVRTADDHRKQTCIIQGIVAYPLDAKILLDKGIITEAQYSILTYNALDIFVDVGTVDVAASREQLSYNKMTIDYLGKRIAQVFNEVKTQFEQKIETCETLWEVRKAIANAAGSPFASFLKDSAIVWRGQQVFNLAKVEVPYVDGTTARQFNYYQFSPKSAMSYEHSVVKIETRTAYTDSVREQIKQAQRYSHFALNFHVRSDINNVFVINDIPGKSAMKLAKAYVRQLAVKNGRKTIVVHYIEPIDGVTRSKTDIEKFLSEIGNPPVVYASQIKDDVVTVERAKATYIKKKNDVYVWKGFNKKSNCVYSRNTWELTEVDLNDMSEVKYYVELDRFTPVNHHKGRIDILDEVIAGFRELFAPLGLHKGSVSQVYGLSKKQVADVKNNKTWIELYSAGQKIIEGNQELFDALIVSHLAEVAFWQYDYKFIRANRNKMKDSAYSKMFDDLIPMMDKVKNGTNVSLRRVEQILAAFDQRTKFDSNAFERRIIDAKNHMKLLGVVNMREVALTPELTADFIAIHNTMR